MSIVSDWSYRADVLLIQRIRLALVGYRTWQMLLMSYRPWPLILFIWER